MPFLRERSGRWSPEKIVAFVGVLLPVAWIAWRTWTGDLGPRPVTEVIHFTGDWVVRLLWITLAVSPAARLFKAPKLMLARRTLGVATAVYAACHLALYALDQKFVLTTVASEIVLRFYLTIGFAALCGLIALAVTSTDGMIRRMGRSWTWLHRLAYPIAVLATIHDLLQSKNNVWQPLLMAGFLVWLFGYRVIQQSARTVSYLHLIALAIVSSALTLAIEIAWYHLRSNVPVERVWRLVLNVGYVIQPCWWVLAAGLAVPLAVFLWRLRPQRTTARRTVSRAPSGATRIQSAS